MQGELVEATERFLEAARLFPHFVDDGEAGLITAAQIMPKLKLCFLALPIGGFEILEHAVDDRLVGQDCLEELAYLVCEDGMLSSEMLSQPR